MPMFDVKMLFSDSQSLAGVASTTAYGQNELDFATQYPDMGSGSPLVVRFVVMTTFATGTSVQFGICFDATTQVPTPSATLVAETAPIAIATLVAGYTFELKVPDQHLQFMNVAYTTVGTPSAGAITAYLDINTGLRHR